MQTTNLNVRTNHEVKDQAETVFNELGLTMTTAINLFLKASIRERGLPFPVRLNNESNCAKGVIANMNALKDLRNLIDDYGYPTAVELFGDKYECVIKDWYHGHKMPTEQELEDIAQKIDKFVLNEYHDCRGLLILQSILPSDDGRYDGILNGLIDDTSETDIYPIKVSVRKDEFNFTAYRILQVHNFIVFENIGMNKYKVALTELGIAYLIQDWLHQKKRLREVDDEKIAHFLSHIHIK